MQKSQIIIVSFLKPMEKETNFISWPNHITLVPFFWTEDVGRTVNKIKEICKNIVPVNYMVGGIKLLGSKNNIKTSEITSNDLKYLHKKIFEMAKNEDPKIDTSYCGNKYNPHITHNQTPYPTEGQKREIKEIYLVLHLYPNKKDKRVLEIIKLG